MRNINVNLGENAYPIYIGKGLLHQGELVSHYLTRPDVAIITNTTVAPLYLNQFENALRRSGVNTVSIALPDGEEYKNEATLNQIYDALIDNRCERSTTILALGGGVIGDLAGYAAATFLRGVPFIQVPTTLLAQVDSSVGGKTGINHSRGKNLIGAFYQPKVVLADTETLNTLPDRELSAGLAEVIKYGLIRDLTFFEWLEQNAQSLLERDADALAYAIERSCSNKAEVVAADEREAGERALLNFGHTFGHAIESGLGYGKWLHGEAVAAGMVLAAVLSQQQGWLSAGEVTRIKTLLASVKFPVDAPDLGIENYLQLMSTDKKIEEGKIRFILLKRIGHAVITSDVSMENIRKSIGECSA